MSGHVYFMLANGYTNTSESFVKIGWSSVCPWARMKTIETTCPLPISLIAIVPGKKSDEFAFHRTFGHLRMRGEWFAWKDDLIEFVNTLPEPDRVTFHRAMMVGHYNAGCADCHRRWLIDRPKRRCLF